MSLPSLNSQAPASQNNVRLVAVDDKHQPQYVIRALALEKSLLSAAARHGVGPDDMPGLYGLCVEAMRATERTHR